ncbi:pyridoxal phosphate-dependent transferase [Lasiosphaeria hispida]|uniref:Pyridoxal phosphate-dependent transferase n=1 Tax=Lasiosphaeria hispida TaxID=260671 RepID=A0AAJ0H7A1_9PEZI|nr:pyridoxal phosphate-dependent transferase [Lasiosphaeria hispida]
MPPQTITTPLGHSLPPEGPHTITAHVPGWDAVAAFRRGDPAILGAMKSMYPRFSPFNEVAQLGKKITTLLDLPPTHTVLLFTDPTSIALARRHAASPHRKPDAPRLAADELVFRAVDFDAVRLFVVAFPAAKAPGIIGVWQDPGIGVSSRLAETLLAEEGAVVWDGAGEVLEGRFLAEGAAHGQLRERVRGLVGRGVEGGHGVEGGDVFLTGTGMASIFRVWEMAMRVRPGTVVALGGVFHSSWHLFDESEGGFKHFGRCDDGTALDELEVWLEGEKTAGRTVSFVFVEFPSNPILVSVDLERLRQLADKYAVPLVIDETIGSFCNIDVMPAADIIVSSLTKSFSGYANVMAGAIIFNPSSPFHSLLRPALTSTFHNDLFLPDATVLLSNSASYLPRSAILNRNALAVATALAASAASPLSPITAVLYPPFTSTHANMVPFLRRGGGGAGPDFPSGPGYGCLLSVDFEDIAYSQAFYEALQFYKGPHLGAHLSLAMNFNDAVWGAEPATARYHAGYNMRPEQVRLAVGLEEAEDLVDTVQAAVEVVVELKRRGIPKVEAVEKE